MKEDYVSFEIAKLLKEKGFNEPCDFVYDNNELKWFFHLFICTGILTNSELGDKIISAPTLQMAMKWLREKYKMYIYIKPLENGNCFSAHLIYNGIDNLIKGGAFGDYESACEAAIKWCLINLI